jgi:uncharacterized integral membrane protein
LTIPGGDLSDLRPGSCTTATHQVEGVPLILIIIIIIIIFIIIIIIPTTATKFDICSHQNSHA